MDGGLARLRLRLWVRLRLRFCLLWRKRRLPRQRAHCAPICVCKVSAANEHARSPAAIGRAEQRSGDRIRAGACLSVASLRPTPGDASSARYPEGARPLARLSFAYFSLAKQRKVRPAAGASPVAGQTQKATGSPYLWLLSFGEAKESNSAYRPKPDLKNHLNKN